MESCFDLESDSYPESAPRKPPPESLINKKRTSSSSSSILSMSSMYVKPLPPSLPMIQASTVLKRYYTNDGRLIIAQEKLQTPKYHFTAHRSNGRLVLRLIDDSCNTTTTDNNKTSDGDDHGFGYNDDDVKVAATGPCLFVDQQNQLNIVPFRYSKLY
ncbi:hypothetical protein QVD17_07675 [Tagetes erecta]|uniref:FAF domain-containing protein n=1 Tax=Tagetes erecta TaxID=13708 RepID=A0AAD8P7I3_TARER|nr:hypothetical protein QVD17_07675 [Tagetes erecta]